MKKYRNIFIIGLALATIGAYTASKFAASYLLKQFKMQESVIVLDRNGIEIAILPNPKGHYMRPLHTLPQEFIDLLLKKEDKYFYYHPGINAGSIARSLLGYPFRGRFPGSSTLTQQVVKNLLGNENERTVYNKVVEAVYAFSLELHTTKENILALYANTAYFGNRAEGLAEAARVYFDASPESLGPAEYTKLLAHISNPSRYPPADIYPRTRENMFELNQFPHTCGRPCVLGIDAALTEKLRALLQTNLARESLTSARNGAIAVIRLGKNTEHNQLLALVGSPYTQSTQHGYQINMALQPRPIGSTAKPFIYAKAFEKGARPYTQVDDREYKYKIGTGFDLYPRNYDGKYRGIVTLHQSLANSLNVPSVRVLEYVSLENFYAFLEDGLGFKPLRPLSSYELGIALGALDMDLLTLTHYFSIFPSQGILKPLDISASVSITPPMASHFPENRQIIDPAYTELVTKILSDRLASVEQFGAAGSLHLSAANYAVKTGTSHDYHDSWTIGYTPDFVVGVWLGNSDNKPMQKLSGQMGAGTIWHDVMEILLHSEYNLRTPLQFAHIQTYPMDGSIEFGLAGDTIEKARNLLIAQELIAEPHDGDMFGFEPHMIIPLETTGGQQASWFINSSPAGESSRISWRPAAAGTYEIRAQTEEKKQTIKIVINPLE
ncbi:MAG: transglycosylase domain-containing protein [Patescibacteria group bacterium]